jgi:Intracellular proteinase inhibitor
MIMPRMNAALTVHSPGVRAPARAPARLNRFDRGQRLLLSASTMILLTCFAACGTATGAERDAPEQQTPVTQAPAPLALRLEVPEQVRAGQSVPIRMVLENRGEAPYELELGGSPIAFDLVVGMPDGSRVWRRLEGMPVEAILQLRTLSGGMEMVFNDSWDQRDNRGRSVGPGTYRVRGVLPVLGIQGGWGTETRTLVIVP